MESWFVIVISLCIGLMVRSILLAASSSKTKGNKINLPPGPRTFPIIGKISLLRKSSTELEAILRNIHRKYGPVVSIRIAHRPAVFVADRTLAHQALVQNGAVFADRPPAAPTNRILSSNQHTISSAAYGPTWRLLRRNLTANILHPSRISSFSNARRWVLQLLLDRLLVTSSDITSPSSTNGVCVKEHFQYAMFCLLVLMCFGDKLDEPKIKDIETVQRRLLLRLRRFNILNFWPKITKILLRKRWQELLQLRQDQQDVLAPLIEARRNKAESESKSIVCYVDTLLDLRLPADVKEREKEMSRKLEMSEMVSLCSEFLNAGTDTTSTALEWIMANIVKHPRIQDKLYAEIKQVLTSKQQQEEEEVGRVVVEEEDLQKMAYLKAVVLEGLRRHPPGHFLLPHAVTEEEVVLGGHAVPEEASINFMVADIGWDPSVWEDPMAFKPERFLGNGGEVVEMITGSKEIKMMPFGAGRRICPGHGLAILHLEYFVANLVWRFEWNYKASASAAEVDLSEKQEFTTVMKYPLKARLSPRSP
nr:cytochrome P450 89A2 [Morus alba]